MTLVVRRSKPFTLSGWTVICEIREQDGCDPLIEWTAAKGPRILKRSEMKDIVRAISENE